MDGINNNIKLFPKMLPCLFNPKKPTPPSENASAENHKTFSEKSREYKKIEQDFFTPSCFERVAFSGFKIALELKLGRAVAITFNLYNCAFNRKLTAPVTAITFLVFLTLRPVAVSLLSDANDFASSVGKLCTSTFTIINTSFDKNLNDEERSKIIKKELWKTAKSVAEVAIYSIALAPGMGTSLKITALGLKIGLKAVDLSSAISKAYKEGDKTQVIEIVYTTTMATLYGMKIASLR